MPPLVKICGLSTPDAVDAAVAAGADMIGLVRFPKSPRHVGLEEGRALSARARGKAFRVALVVDADDAELEAVVAALDPDLIQLHGAETPERVAAIRARFGRPVMKAVGIADAADLTDIERYAAVADRVLLDAKPPKRIEALPGGNGLAFDWRLVAGLDPDKPFMLSGGLSPETVAAAIELTGIQRRRCLLRGRDPAGSKSSDKIAAFVKAARAAWAGREAKDTAA